MNIKSETTPSRQSGRGALQREQFRRELYPFMVGQRFTGMEFITMCRERYQVEKGILLSVLTLNASETRVSVRPYRTARSISNLSTKMTFRVG